MIDSDELELQGYVSIPSYEGLYLINKQGRIYSVRRRRFLRIQKSGRYPYIALVNKEGKRKSEFIHRLLAYTFIPNPEGKPCVNHKDGDKKNNELSNLEWCTAKENSRHAVELGLSPLRGSSNHMSYFDSWDVQFIRHWYEQGTRICDLARLFQSTHSCVSDIVKRRSWSHI